MVPLHPHPRRSSGSAGENSLQREVLAEQKFCSGRRSLVFHEISVVLPKFPVLVGISVGQLFSGSSVSVLWFGWRNHCK